MKKLLLLALTATGFAVSAQIGNYAIGETVDDFTGTDTKGVEHTLYWATSEGKYVFLDFFFTTCPPCQATQKYFNELYDKYGCNDGDIYTLSITGYPGDTDVKVDNFEATYGGPTAHSPAISIEGNGVAITSQFAPAAYPTYILIGPDNKLIKNDIWPISNVTTFENALPNGADPEPMECAAMGATDLNANQISVYPTVSNGNFTIAFGKNTDSNIGIFDMAGKQVYSNSYKGKQTVSVDVKLASGIYFLRVNTADNKSSMKKIIIK